MKQSAIVSPSRNHARFSQLVSRPVTNKSTPSAPFVPHQVSVSVFPISLFLLVQIPFVSVTSRRTTGSLSIPFAFFLLFPFAFLLSQGLQGLRVDSD